MGDEQSKEAQAENGGESAQHQNASQSSPDPEPLSISDGGPSSGSAKASTVSNKSRSSGGTTSSASQVVDDPAGEQQQQPVAAPSPSPAPAAAPDEPPVPVTTEERRESPPNQVINMEPMSVMPGQATDEYEEVPPPKTSSFRSDTDEGKNSAVLSSFAPPRADPDDEEDSSPGSQRSSVRATQNRTSTSNRASVQNRTSTSNRASVTVPAFGGGGGEENKPTTQKFGGGFNLQSSAPSARNSAAGAVGKAADPVDLSRLQQRGLMLMDPALKAQLMAKAADPRSLQVGTPYSKSGGVAEDHMVSEMKARQEKMQRLPSVDGSSQFSKLVSERGSLLMEKPGLDTKTGKRLSAAEATSKPGKLSGELLSVFASRLESGKSQSFRAGAGAAGAPPAKAAPEFVQKAQQMAQRAGQQDAAAAAQEAQQGQMTSPQQALNRGSGGPPGAVLNRGSGGQQQDMQNTNNRGTAAGVFGKKKDVLDLLGTQQGVQQLQKQASANRLASQGSADGGRAPSGQQQQPVFTGFGFGGGATAAAARTSVVDNYDNAKPSVGSTADRPDSNYGQQQAQPLAFMGAQMGGTTNMNSNMKSGVQQIAGSSYGEEPAYQPPQYGEQEFDPITGERLVRKEKQGNQIYVDDLERGDASNHFRPNYDNMQDLYNWYQRNLSAEAQPKRFQDGRYVTEQALAFEKALPNPEMVESHFRDVNSDEYKKYVAHMPQKKMHTQLGVMAPGDDLRKLLTDIVEYETGLNPKHPEISTDKEFTDKDVWEHEIQQLKEDVTNIFAVSLNLRHSNASELGRTYITDEQRKELRERFEALIHSFGEWYDYQAGEVEGARLKSGPRSSGDSGRGVVSAGVGMGHDSYLEQRPASVAPSSKGKDPDALNSAIFNSVAELDEYQFEGMGQIFSAFDKAFMSDNDMMPSSMQLPTEIEVTARDQPVSVTHVVTNDGLLAYYHNLSKEDREHYPLRNALKHILLTESWGDYDEMPIRPILLRELLPSPQKDGKLYRMYARESQYDADEGMIKKTKVRPEDGIDFAKFRTPQFMKERHGVLTKADKLNAMVRGPRDWEGLEQRKSVLRSGQEGRGSKARQSTKNDGVKERQSLLFGRQSDLM
ncbi:unnamed protein product [Amoebophrya sp. A120]|nr:unnamed protein product [Amoebophrya sp. A120]|eukprot:GSA120T00012426001.1